MHKKDVKHLKDAIQFIRNKMSSDLQLQQIAMLIELADNHPDPVTQTDLAIRVEISQGSISRNLKILGDKMVKSGRTHRNVGLGLVKVRPDLYETRKLSASLTQKGVKTLTTLFKISGG